MRVSPLKNLLRRNTRRLLDLPAVYQRRPFKALRREFYDQLWRQAAQNVGADYAVLPGGHIRIRRGDLITFVELSEIMLDAALTVAVSADKALTYDLLTAKGYAVPRHLIFQLSEISKAEAFLAAQSAPVVVKPASGTGGGRGVTTGITATPKLRHAAQYAAGFNSRVMIEEQLSGGSYRLLYLDGNFVDAIRRDSPVVVGDGRKTVRELVRQENQRRCRQRPFSALSPLIMDKDCRNHLAWQGRSADSRPAAGEVVEVKRAVNENGAGQNHNVRHSIHPDIVAAGARLVSDLGMRFAGLDLMSDDASVPLEESGGFFTEINVNPGIHHHYLVADPDGGVPVADVILDYLLTKRTGVMTL